VSPWKRSSQGSASISVAALAVAAALRASSLVELFTVIIISKQRRGAWNIPKP
jgi:hypothetical protein